MEITHSSASAVNMEMGNDNHCSDIVNQINALPSDMFKSARAIDEIIIHCSATKEGRAFTAAHIRRWHLERGFSDIGYHFVVLLDGSVQPGRPINQIGAHCLNHNRRSVGICYIGGLDVLGNPKDTRTPEQRVALPAIIRRIRHHHPRARVYAHRDFAAKACPCFDARREYDHL